MWHFIFKNGATIYLSEAVYAGQQHLRPSAWVAALMRAAAMGEWQEMQQDVRAFSVSGKECEALLAALDAKYNKSELLLQQKALQHLTTIRRDNRSLTESMTALRRAIIECRNHKYNPDNATLMLALHRMVRPEEYLNAEVHAMQRGDDCNDAEAMIDVLYDIGLKVDAMSGSVKQGGPGFGGGTTHGRQGGNGQGNKKGNKKPKRGGYVPDANGVVPGGERKGPSRCNKCGKDAHTNGKPCPAESQTCNTCGEKGHFFIRCPRNINRRNDNNSNRKPAQGNGAQPNGAPSGSDF